jgi:aminoglycoside phosphotransferase (APT) family kinase protein
MRPGGLIAVGRTSDVFEWGAGTVIKVPRPDVPDHWAVLEASYTRAVRSVGVAAPEVVEVTRLDGRHAIVFERIDGRTMWEHMLERPDAVPELAAELGRVHRRIFEAGPPAGLEGLIDRTRGKLRESTGLTEREREEAVDALDRLPRGAALLHGDLHPGNVLMADSGPVVIDWFDASIGLPVADVVRSSLLVRPSGAAAVQPHLPGADEVMLRRLHDAYIREMSDVMTPWISTVGTWEAVRAASRLAERGLPDEAVLVDLWQRRGDGARMLLDVLRGGSPPR